ncbi:MULTISPECIES: tetratricopeptide repeat-containing response regulator [Marinobacter]|uniref:Response regulator n=1 Tax=Marinobacter xiaoshiensis TaxID=3073652 RepID=A0ABU2HGP2_9GAMM|nr:MULTISPECIES: tetratricopeptide repeat-containing response regulator [unclassified Marinobacter]MBK1874300.1 response regulator [Marinobacter sp. 1-3A]MBK1887475.1 response regulator [Marinobacter sp. DY40_1A1]MDS1310248.1 response regulator [Marinobacter sp. F60267]
MSDPNENVFGKLSYLVVDDFENFRISMRHMLRSCGADNVELVAHAKPAIEYCTYNHVDVVLCDYNLGKGKNGQHILEELRHKKLLKRSSLFLMVTSESSREMVMGAREYQPDAYLTKPINHAMLEKRLSSLISQRNALLPINREIDRENYPEAISLCNAALSRLPRYKTWLMKTLGELYFLLGDLSYAIKVYDEVLSQRELSWARVGRNKVLLANHRYDEAVESLRKLIKSHPDYMEAYDLLAEGLERQNRSGQAQNVLELATTRSPNALLRQKHLAELAEANQDMETATEAWRQTVRLGAHSIHHSPDHHIALAHALCDLSDGDTDEGSQALAHEAISVLASMERQFSESKTLELHSLVIQCRIQAGRGEVEKANSMLESISERLSEIHPLELEMGLDYAKTLYRLDNVREAKTLLARLHESYGEDPEAARKIESLLDEPVSFRMKIKARGLNREGIAAFESGALKEAEETFSKALEIIPDHPALNLNLIQVLIKQHEDTGSIDKLTDRCQQHISRLDDLPEQHGQYRRYLALQRKLKALTL